MTCGYGDLHSPEGLLELGKPTATITAAGGVLQLDLLALANSALSWATMGKAHQPGWRWLGGNLQSRPYKRCGAGTMFSLLFA